MDLMGKVALVTGAGSGIGRASAVAFAAAGARVLVVDIDEAGGEETVHSIVHAGGEATLCVADLSWPHGIREAFAAAEHVFGGLDIVHNNAGLVGGEPAFPGMDLERIRLVIDVNLAAVCMGTQAAVPLLRARGGGAIVATASVAALAPFPADPVYGATKAGVVSFVQAVAPALAAEGIRVNAVLPGLVATPMIAKTGDGVRPAEWLVPVIAATRVLAPEDIAAAVLDLVRSDASGETRVVANPD